MIWGTLLLSLGLSTPLMADSDVATLRWNLAPDNVVVEVTITALIPEGMELLVLQTILSRVRYPFTAR